MIACTNTQNFEEGENWASTISVDHTIGYGMNLFGFEIILFGSDMILFGFDMILFGSDMILFGSNFKFQDLSTMLVVALINFGVKNQLPQFPSEVADDDLMSVFFYEFFDIIIYKYLDIL